VPAGVVDFVSQSSQRCNLLGQRSVVDVGVGVGGSIPIHINASVPLLLFLLLCWSSLPFETCLGRTTVPGSSDTAAHCHTSTGGVRGGAGAALQDGVTNPRGSCRWKCGDYRNCSPWPL
jgi:hypothetical protein